jgi:hypothetical protein
MTEPVLTGHCMCGAVRFEVREPLVFAGYCHCTRCQRRTGTAAAAFGRIVPDSLAVTAGEELISSFDPPDGFSKLFCSACGSALWSRSQEDPSVISVRLGAIDRDPAIRPSFRQFVAYAATWEDIPDDGLPRFPEARPPQT